MFGEPEQKYSDSGSFPNCSVIVVFLGQYRSINEYRWATSGEKRHGCWQCKERRINEIIFPFLASVKGILSYWSALSDHAAFHFNNLKDKLTPMWALLTEAPETQLSLSCRWSECTDPRGLTTPTQEQQNGCFARERNIYHTVFYRIWFSLALQEALTAGFWNLNVFISHINTHTCSLHLPLAPTCELGIVWDVCL